MPDAPRPSDRSLTTVAASVTLAESKQLRQLANERQVPMTQLIRAALSQTYGVPAPHDKANR